MIESLKRKLANVLGLVRIFPEEKSYSDLARRTALPPVRTDFGNVLLVQWAWDPFIWVRLIPIVWAMKKSGWKIQFLAYNFQTAPPSWKRRVRTFFEGIRWRRLYQIPFLGRIVLDLRDYPDRATWVLAERILRESVKGPGDVFRLQIDGIPVGDLVYDTYLRNKPAATLDIHDPLFLEIVARAIHVQTKFKEYVLGADRPNLFLTTFSVYIHNGIPVRQALASGVPVLSLGFHDPALKVIDKDFPSHLRNYMRYRKAFAEMSVEAQERARKESRAAMDRRVRGDIDVAISYMKTSAYSSASDPVELEWQEKFAAEKKQKVVLLLHCFFDGPHVYRNMLFNDFWDWAVFMARETSKLKNVQLYVKPHPNGLPGNEPYIEELMKIAKGAILLPKEISNNALSRAGFSAALTVYGTVAHELPFLGVPVINAGDNPHVDYSFCLTPSSREELTATLEKIDNGTFRSKIDLDEIGEFYYMHNLYPQRGRLSERGREINSISPYHFDDAALKVFASKPEAELLEYWNSLVTTLDGLVASRFDDGRP